MPVQHLEPRKPGPTYGRINLVLRDDAGLFEAPPPRRPVRVHVLNTLGSVTMTAGSALHHAGLTLCGWAGWLDAVADEYR